MGDYAGSYGHTGDEEVKYVDHGEWSWTRDAGTEDTGALNEGEKFFEEEAYDYDEEEKVCAYEEEAYDYDEEEHDYEAGINFELEYTCDSSQQVAVEDGSEPVRSASKGHQVVSAEAKSESSKSSNSSQDDKPKLKPKTKKTKGARTRQVKHLQESPLEVSSDPGYGGGSASFHPEDPRSMSISRVNGWFEDAALEEHPKDGMLAQQGSIEPRRRPPPRRPAPGADMGVHATRRSSSLPVPVPQCEYDTEDYSKKLARDSSGTKHQGHEEDHRVAPHNPSADIPSPYRVEAKPLDKAFKFMRTGAVGIVQVSRQAAIGSWKASKVAAVTVQKKTMEMKCLAGPVLSPIIDAVVEESKQQLMGPNQAGRASRGRGRGRGPGRGPGSGRGRGLGRGRGPGGPPMERPMQPMMGPGMAPGPRPGMRPVVRPGMVAGPGPGGMRPVMRPGPGMRPVMRPGMSAGPGPGMRPVMRPGMAAGPGPGMRPVMRPGMAAGPGPGMRPVMRPGMGPPGNQQSMPGQGRGQFRPVGARPMPPAQPIDY